MRESFFIYASVKYECFSVVPHNKKGSSEPKRCNIGANSYLIAMCSQWFKRSALYVAGKP